MADLPMYLFRNDVDLLVGHLDDDPEIAWIVSVDDLNWHASQTHPPLVSTRYALWHIPAGFEISDHEGKTIEGVDPWAGWTARPNRHDRQIPNIGSRPSFVTLSLGIFEAPVIGRSDFGWIGNYFAPIGKKALPETERWWKQLRRWVAKQGVRIPFKGPIDGPKPIAYAFPDALAAIRSGAARNPMPPRMKAHPPSK